MPAAKLVKTSLGTQTQLDPKKSDDRPASIILDLSGGAEFMLTLLPRI